MASRAYAARGLDCSMLPIHACHNITTHPPILANSVLQAIQSQDSAAEAHCIMTEVQSPMAPSISDQSLEQASRPSYSFNFSDFLRREYRFGLDPDRPSCKAYIQGHCPEGSRCPNKHHVSSSYNKYVVQLIEAVYCSHKLIWSL